MGLNATLDQADHLAEAGNVQGAVDLLEAARRSAEAAGEKVDVARLQVELGMMVARSGELAAALPLLQVAEASAERAGAAEVVLEARVAHSSVLGALGRFSEAIPALRNAVAALQRSHSDTALCAEAVAELAAFETMVNPNNRAAVAAVLAEQEQR